jgi:hypothetical protein
MSGWIPGRKKGFFSSPKRLERLRLPVQWVPAALSLVVKQPGA